MPSRLAPLRRYSIPSLSLLLLLVTTPFVQAEIDLPSGEYHVDKTHAYITFSYSHLGFSNPHLSFDKFDATLTADTANPENSRIEVRIQADSINSRVEEFDQHLIGEEFFDTAKFPDITFTSTRITKTGEQTYDVVGNLTIKGITKPVTLATTINKTGQHPMLKVPDIGISATGKLSRSEFSLGQYAPAVGDEVSLFITAEFLKQ